MPASLTGQAALASTSGLVSESLTVSNRAAGTWVTWPEWNQVGNVEAIVCRESGRRSLGIPGGGKTGFPFAWTQCLCQQAPGTKIMGTYSVKKDFASSM